jgi:hypothetical protein
MNEDTRIAVCCYAGDQQQVEQMLDLYLHHQRPVVIFSPEDSKAIIQHPGVENRHFGKNQMLGPDSQATFLGYLKILLTYPEKYFLVNEPDSFCLDPKIPDYLYAEPDTVWTTGGGQPMSIEPPWFLSRKTIEAFIAVADSVVYSPDLPWVALYIGQLIQAGGLPWKRHLNCCLCPMSGVYDPTTKTVVSPGIYKWSPYDALSLAGKGPGEEGQVTGRGGPLDAPGSQFYADLFARGLKSGMAAARNGANMMHSCKSGVAARALLAEYQKYLTPSHSPHPLLRAQQSHRGVKA